MSSISDLLEQMPRLRALLEVADGIREVKLQALIGRQAIRAEAEWLAGTAVYGTVRTVVWEDGGREPSSYPI